MKKLSVVYPGRTTTPDANYPSGAFKDQSVIGLNDGTPVQNNWANEREGAFQGLVASVGSEPNGETETAIQSQIVEAIQSHAFGQTRPRGMGPESLCAGLHLADNAAFPQLSPHASSYVAYNLKSGAIGWDYDKDRPILLIIDSASGIRSVPCWDYSTAPAFSAAWTDSLASVSSYEAVACDGESVYVSYTDTGFDVHVAKFALDPWTGTPLWDADTGAASTGRDSLIIANDTQVVLLRHGSTSWRVYAFAKSNGAMTSGQGNGSAYDLNNQACRITSVGDHVFWPCYSGGNYILCSAKLSSMSISDYSAKIVSVGDELTDVKALNSDTVVCVSKSTSTAESYLRAYHLGIDEFADVARLDAPASNQSGDNFYPRMVFDGLNLNVVHDVEGTDGGLKTAVVRHVNGTRFSRHMDVASFAQISAPITGIGNTIPNGNNNAFYDVLFDGRDVWVYYTDSAGSNYAIHRIQAPGVRNV